MSLFAEAIDDLFADPNLARDALWRAGGIDPAVPLRVILRRPDRIGNFGDTRIIAGTATVDIRIGDAPALAEGDTVEVDGVMYLVQGEPLRDTERLVWTAETRQL
jgi:hypothetical protein